MKTAVLVYGEYREFDNVVESWKVLNTFDCDFYFSTWNKSKQNNNSLGIFKEFDVTKDMILKYYPQAIVDIRNPYDYVDCSDWWGSSAKIYNHWKNCVKLLDDSKKEYDFILILRPDLYLSFKEEHTKFPYEILKSLYEKNSLFMIGGYRRYDDIQTDTIFFAADYFIFGKYNIVKKLLEDSSTFGGDIHHSLGKYIYESNIEVIENNIFNIDIVRPNSFYYNYDGVLIKVNPINEPFYEKDYFHKKQIEWDNSLIKRPLSD